MVVFNIIMYQMYHFQFLIQTYVLLSSMDHLFGKHYICILLERDQPFPPLEHF